MTPGQARLLLSDAGRAAVEAAQAGDLTPAARVSTATALGRRFGTELGPLALQQALLRQRAGAKHPHGHRLWWTAEGLEQSTSLVVAEHRAARLVGVDLGPVVDLCCGLGGDLMALAAQAPGALGVDLDEARLLLAAANSDELGLDTRLVRADALSLPLPADACVLVDPARRSGGRRVFDPRAYAPPLDAVLELDVGSLAVKVAPGIDYDALADHLEVELVSLHGDVKEAVLWAGEARRGSRRTATLLPSGDVLTTTGAPMPRVAGPGRWLLEPDGAAIRAHLVAEVCQAVDGWLLDATIAYVSADAPVPTPFGRWYAVEEVLPFSLKGLRERLRARDAGTLVVKKRGTAVEPEVLRRQLRLTGSVETTVVLTRQAGRQIALIVTPQGHVGTH